ncbi:MAG: hypothetical protein Q8J61_02085, partial [Sulfuricella sp.]|nr:hypothetical protein [Sulfuricella sp.]
MSLLMEALKRAEREKHKVDTDESAPEESSAGPAVEPDWPPGPEPLQDEESFPSLKWAEPTPGDSAPAAMAFPAEPALSLAGYPHPNPLPEGLPSPQPSPARGEGAMEKGACFDLGAKGKGAGFDLLPPEPAPATATAIPPLAATEPALSPSADATQPQSVIPPLQPPARREEPAPVVSPWSLQSSGNPAGTLLAGESPLPRTEPPLRNGTPSAGRQPPAQETTTAQRQQHAANVLAATKKTPDRSRLPLAAVSAAAILLLAGGVGALIL